VASGCPICEQPLPATAEACANCGFPTALAIDALRVLTEGEPTPVPTATYSREAEPPPRRRERRPAAPDPQEELCHRIAQETDAHLAILQELGGETPDVVSDLRQAALSQAEGRVVEALDILRRALGRVQDETEALFARRIRDLEQRDAALQRSGIGTAIPAATARMRELFQAGNRLEAIAQLKSTDLALARIEGDWKGLQGLLKQVESLREGFRETGGSVAEIERDIQEVRRLLAGPGTTAESLDKASQVAARAVMVLHEALPKAIEAELAEHDEVLATLPDDHARARTARALHTEAVRHLRRGRLPESSTALLQLRAVIEELKREPPVARPDPRATAPEPPAEFLNRLLVKARTLAARVRTLPPDSEIAYEAAAEIRRATELLRARQLDEAESTLARLMRTLESEPAAEA
jgi:tetratricopeptide (TPR) repeat protein